MNAVAAESYTRAALAHLRRQLLRRPSPEAIINAHISEARHFGVVFDTFTKKGRAAFLRRNRKPRQRKAP